MTQMFYRLVIKMKWNYYQSTGDLAKKTKCIKSLYLKMKVEIIHHISVLELTEYCVWRFLERENIRWERLNY